MPPWLPRFLECAHHLQILIALEMIADNVTLQKREGKVWLCVLSPILIQFWLYCIS